MWFKRKKEEPTIEVPKIVKQAPQQPKRKMNEMQRSIQGTLALANQSPIISFGFSGGNQAGNINAIINKTLPVSVAVSRQLALENGIVKKYISTNTAGVTGPEGLYIRPCVHISDDDEENQRINHLLEREFYKWAESCSAFSVAGDMDISTFTRLVERTRAIDGDCFIRIHKSKNSLPQVEIIDSMRVGVYLNQYFDNGNFISNGIEYEANTYKPLAVWITRYNPIMYTYDIGNRERVPMDEILHLYQLDFPTQQRGIPDAHASTEELKGLEEFMVAAITSRKVAASAMAFITSGEVNNVDLTTEDGSPQYYRTDYLDPAAVVELKPGQDIKTVNPTQTTDGISEFVDNQLMMIAMDLDITKQALTSDTSNASFSAAKLTDKLQQSTFKARTNALVVNVLKPLYKEWLKSAMINNPELGDLNFSDFDLLTNAQYVPTKAISLDPYKDLQTEVLAIENGLKSRQMVISEMGYDPAIVMEEINKEKNMDKEEQIDGNEQESSEDDQSNTD